MRHAVRLSSRLSVRLQPRPHRRGRPSHGCHGQPRPSLHAGGDLRQGARICRARSFAAACAYPAPAGGREGEGRVRADLLGRGDRRDRTALARDPRRRRRRGDPAVLVRGVDGPGPVLRGPPLLPRARCEPPGPHDLRRHRVRGLARHPGRRHRQRLGADGGCGPGRPLGRECGLLDDQRDDARQAGARPRRLRHRRRSVSHADRPAGGPPPHGPPGHRRGAGARRDARPDRGGSPRPRLHRAGDARHRAARRAREGVFPGGGRADRRPRRRDDRPVRPALRGGPTDLHPHRHRDLASRQRGDDVPHPRVPAGAHGRLRRSARRRSPVVGRGVRLRLRGPGAAGPHAHAAAADRQHDPPGARADRPAAGPGDPLALRVQLEPGGRVSEPDAGPRGARARGPLHRRARADPHRHRLLCRPRPAGDDLAGAPRPLPLLRAVHAPARPAGAAAPGPGEVELGGVSAPGAHDGRRRGALREEPAGADPRVPGEGRRDGAGDHLRGDRGRRRGHRREPTRRGAVHGPRDGRDPAGRGRDRGNLVAPLSSRRPGRERADERPRNRSGRRPGVPFELGGSVAGMRTLFLHPPSYEGFDGGAGSRYQARREVRSFWYPTWLAQPAALVPGSRLVDAPPDGLTLADVRPLARDYELAVLHTSTPSFAHDVRVAEALQTDHPRLRVGFVGAHVAVNPAASLAASPAIDFVTRSEFDFTLKEVAEGRPLGRVLGVSYRDGGGAIRHTPERPKLEDMDALPSVVDVYRRDLTIENYVIGYLLHPYVSLYTGRGCRSKCTFCLLPQTVGGHRYRTRSVEHVPREVALAQRYFPHVREFFFDDDTFTDDLPRVEAIARGLGRLGVTWSCNAKANVPPETLEVLKDNGLRLLLVGYESGNQGVLNSVKKGVRLDVARRFTRDARALGIRIHGTFVLGLPGETCETIEETIRFACELEPDTIQVSIAAR